MLYRPPTPALLGEGGEWAQGWGTIRWHPVVWGGVGWGTAGHGEPGLGGGGDTHWHRARVPLATHKAEL